MDRLKEFLDWHCENPHNVNFKMIVGKEDQEETLKAMHEISELLYTGLTPEQIMELKERDTAKEPTKDSDSGVRYTDDYICPNCGKHFTGTGIAEFCYHCGQRLKWEEL